LSNQNKLIIGCGNLLLSDEGLGVHLIEYLKQQNLPEDIELIDGGTAGFELIEFIRGAQKVVIVDAVKAGGRPGQIYRLGPADFETESRPKMSLHGISLKDVFASAEKLGPLPKIKIIGAEPAEIKEGTELSAEIKQILPKLAEVVIAEIEKM